MRTTSPTRVTRPAALIAAIAGLVGALACGDIAPPTAPDVVAPSTDALFSGYALASGKVDSTVTKKP